MIKINNKVWVACLAAACIQLSVPSVQAEPRTSDWSASCSNGDFKGTVGGTYWSDSARNTVVQTSWYKITRSNGQGGGNKANLNTKLQDLNSGLSYDGAKSGDNLMQDDVQHDISLENMSLSSPRVLVQHQFVFDKSGSDPKCNVFYQILL